MLARIQQHWWWLLIVVSGVFLALVVPPFQKPDEIVHYYKTVSVAHGTIICAKDEAGVFVNPLPQAIHQLPLRLFAERVAFYEHIKYPWQLSWQALAQPQTDWSLVNEPAPCSLPFLFYLPTGLALALPMALQLPPIVIFYLGRLVSLALALGLFYYAYRRIPATYRPLLLLLLLMPMTLHQLSSFSKDALHLGFGAVSLALLLDLLSHPKKITGQNLALLILNLGLVVLSRPQYGFFIFLPLALPFRKRRFKFLRASLLMSILSAVALLIVVIGLSLSIEVYSAKASSLQNGAPDSYVYPDLQLVWLKEHPQLWSSVITQTLSANATYYWESMIGIFGWLDYRLPWYVYGIYSAAMAWVLFQLRDKLPATKQILLVLSLVISGTFIGLLLAMYLYATPVAALTIDGMQGRYFLLLLPLVIWWMSALWQLAPRVTKILLIGAVFVSIGWTVIDRYYNYAEFYYVHPQSLQEIAVPNAEATSISATSQDFVIPITPQVSKISGIALQVAENTKPVTKPHRFQILDAQCQQVLAETVFEAKLIPRSGLLQVRTPMVKVKDQVCVRIQPYKVSASETERLLIEVNGAYEPSIGVLALF